MEDKIKHMLEGAMIDKEVPAMNVVPRTTSEENALDKIVGDNATSTSSRETPDRWPK